MAISINSINQSVFSIIAMLITLLSFLVLSLQIAFISILWLAGSFLQHIIYKLGRYSSIER